VETRAIGVSLGFSTAVSIFGGLAPLVATWLIATTGDSLSPSYYLIFTALLSLFALMGIQLRSRRAPQALAQAA
jgi:MHS family proline/betaine transporter-like MFS transporter